MLQLSPRVSQFEQATWASVLSIEGLSHISENGCDKLKVSLWHNVTCKI